MHKKVKILKILDFFLLFADNLARHLEHQEVIIYKNHVKNNNIDSVRGLLKQGFKSLWYAKFSTVEPMNQDRVEVIKLLIEYNLEPTTEFSNYIFDYATNEQFNEIMSHIIKYDKNLKIIHMLLWNLKTYHMNKQSFMGHLDRFFSHSLPIHNFFKDPFRDGEFTTLLHCAIENWGFEFVSYNRGIFCNNLYTQ